eukprot:NODE_9369_length_1429_cov_2.767281.p1 GENE.NODE_9369_length_1429_cov_2.767281~~NODE_9369_length_1429_cov_2.767281.p1  ORF type:complete len:380 (-),score=55.48 NODE_9369_length_1429_cov_2.767281:290-1357(-)
MQLPLPPQVLLAFPWPRGCRAGLRLARSRRHEVLSTLPWRRLLRPLFARRGVVVGNPDALVPSRCPAQLLRPRHELSAGGERCIVASTSSVRPRSLRCGMRKLAASHRPWALGVDSLLAWPLAMRGMASTARAPSESSRPAPYLEMVGELDALANAGKLEEAEALLELVDPRADSPRNRTLLYNTILNACHNAKQVERAGWWLREMRRRCVLPNHKTFGKLIHAAGHLGRVREAEGFFMAMVKSMRGSRPGQIPLVGPAKYNMLINACARSGDPRRAVQWMRRMMRSAGAPPDAYTFGSALNACQRANDFARAEALLVRMPAMRVDPMQINPASKLTQPAGRPSLASRPRHGGAR